ITLIVAFCATALAAAPRAAHAQLGKLVKRAADAATTVATSAAGEAATVAAVAGVAGGVSPTGQVVAAVARGASQAAAARAAKQAGTEAAGRGARGAGRAAASVVGGGGRERSAEARQEARAREFERFQTCVATAIPSLGEPAPTSPEMERVDAELQVLQQQAMAMAMTGRGGDAAQVEALQDRVLVLTSRQMVLRYPELTQRCGPPPAPGAR
ncbi:MAG TPA: hypothetical protein VEZ47_08745, partial [Gemmatirosa sp.]|nr:hypothetical protein [Gemmatirosa sp.]